MGEEDSKTALLFVFQNRIYKEMHRKGRKDGKCIFDQLSGYVLDN